MSKRHSILPARDSFFISNAGKIESVWKFKMNSIAIGGTKIKISYFFKCVLKRIKKRKKSMHQSIRDFFKTNPTTSSCSANISVY